MVANNDAGVFHNLLLPARVPIVNPQARALLRGYATRCGAAPRASSRRPQRRYIASISGNSETS